MKERLPHWFKQKIPDAEIIYNLEVFFRIGN